jgi:hypothetical protein
MNEHKMSVILISEEEDMAHYLTALFRVTGFEAYTVNNMLNNA